MVTPTISVTLGCMCFHTVMVVCEYYPHEGITESVWVHVHIGAPCVGASPLCRGLFISWASLLTFHCAYCVESSGSQSMHHMQDSYMGFISHHLLTWHIHTAFSRSTTHVMGGDFKITSHEVAVEMKHYSVWLMHWSSCVCLSVGSYFGGICIF